MAKSTEQERRRAVTQTLASWAIEGFQPSARYLALTERFIVGEISSEEMRQALNEDRATALVSSAA